MNILDVFLNPVMIALFVSMLTHIYIKWKYNKDQKKNKKNKKKKYDDVLIPFAVFVVVWFITYAYMSSSDEIDTKPAGSIAESLSKSVLKNTPISLSTLKNNIVNGSDSSVNLVSTGIQIPNKLPDTLFEMQ